MQVLHVVGRSHRRGAEQVAMELAAELDRLGHVDELVAVGPGHEGDRVPELPTLTSSSEHGPLTLVRAGLALRRVLRRTSYDLVVAHGAAAAAAAALAAPRRRPPFVVWQRILGLADRSFSGPDALLWRFVCRRVDAVVALTPEMGDEVRRLGFDGPVWPLPNARSTDRFDGLDRATAALTLRSELGVPATAPLVGFVGYLVDQKRPERAVDVLSALDGHPDARLVVVGTGPLAGAVAARAERAGVADRVHLLGHRDDVPMLLAGFDVFVLTSGDEGVPGVVIEAAMAGCPVVTHRLGGVADVVVDGVTGRVVDDDDVQVVAAAVAEVLSDDAFARQLSAAALARSEAFSMAAVARRYDERFRHLVGGEAQNDHVR
ncbi:MAG: glycosyltransferase [Actinobacteria bacterium]|nr:glycosyltransferase [Actinomycetota bacterium]